VARKIVWSDLAVEDLEAAVEFIAKYSEAYAANLAQLAVDAAESLARFPNRGHRVPDPKLSRFRELIIGSYRLIYHVESKRVLIVAVLHGHRALRRALKSRA
jgi:addiction module RelE/StbE family toxin